jgi:hypothetical protein
MAIHTFAFAAVAESRLRAHSRAQGHALASKWQRGASPDGE